MGDIRVAVVDDHLIIRRGLRLLLEEYPEFEFVGEAATGDQAIALVAAHEPHVVLMDINLEGAMDGIEATRQIKDKWDNVQIIMITMNEESEKIRRAIEAGAGGYLLKDVDSRTLAEAIHTVLTGGSAVNPKVSRRILNEMMGLSARHTQPPTAALSEREKQVLALLFEGKSNLEIGDVLCITEKTVKAHMTSLLRKLGVKDRTQAVLYAMKNNLVEPRG